MGESCLHCKRLADLDLGDHEARSAASEAHVARRDPDTSGA